MELNKTTDLLDLVKGEGVALERKGSEWIGLCPFHVEKTPSFSVNPHKGNGVWYCHGCHQGGDSAMFIARAWGVRLGAALRYLQGTWRRPPRHRQKRELLEETRTLRKLEFQRLLVQVNTTLQSLRRIQRVDPLSSAMEQAWLRWESVRKEAHEFWADPGLVDRDWFQLVAWEVGYEPPEREWTLHYLRRPFDNYADKTFGQHEWLGFLRGESTI